jgi:hypothetical protein
MSYFYPLTAILLYILIAWQDFRYRAVNWILFLLLAIANISYSLYGLHMPLWALLQQTGLNVLLIGSQLLLLKLYFSLKNRKVVTIADRYIGWGDIVLYGTLCFLFPPLILMCFHLLSLLCCLLLYATLHFSHHEPDTRQVPLAGIQCCLLLIMAAIQLIQPFPLYDDTWLLNLLTHA